MAFSIIIPARYASSRLLGKPLREICGKPMIQWVVETAQRSSADNVWVATDNEEIQRCVEGFGGHCVMTSADLSSGTDRLQQAASILGLADSHCIVNVQGDEPLMPPQVIDQVAANLQNTTAGLATLCERIHSVREYLDPNAVKVAFSNSGRALYFSRSPIPMRRDYPLDEDAQLDKDFLVYRHLGIYAYRTAFLNRFVQWPEHQLEKTEKLEQLRALANDVDIHVQESVQAIPAGVDTEADLQRVARILNELKS